MKEIKVVIGALIKVELLLNTRLPSPHIAKIHREIGSSHEAQFKIMIIKQGNLTKKGVGG